MRQDEPGLCFTHGSDFGEGLPLKSSRNRPRAVARRNRVGRFLQPPATFLLAVILFLPAGTLLGKLIEEFLHHDMASELNFLHYWYSVV